MVGLDLSSHLAMLSLSIPYTEQSLKRAFRLKAKEHHPDVGGNTVLFQECRAAYEYLLEHCSDEQIARIFYGTQTRDGKFLSELVLGLGPRENGVPCKSCEGRGYTTEYGMSYSVCTLCDEYGHVPLRTFCYACNRTGKYTTRSGDVVTCFRCQGTGVYTHPRTTRPCTECGGSKTVYSQGKAMYYAMCYRCSGTGELPIYNPVLRKGALQ